MKLYYAPGACSMASHIALNEADETFSIEKVDLAAGKTESGADFKRINPKGYVPTLELDDGEVLTEGPAILQYIADRNPDSRLAPKAGTFERVRLQEHLNFISTEIHKSFGPLFYKAASDDMKAFARGRAELRLGYADRILSDGRRYLMGEDFTVADAYLFTVARWAIPTGIGLDRQPNLQAYVKRVSERPAIRKTLAAEDQK
ncbi:glutathione transferase GstA [Amphiplicatus metriothermophilus]|uniref:Glutathione S-transferase n=1 Tax=Amphiplicatus metriothermophilus TaxID=1519374 RepID=A0A239PPC6_9PROT|nr:glutathione transferase GstA [Amphiplicatus metriothermophilus]MBB5518684.1 glutathione S-transferase [Amphiplicatus metriothermophilus]SNT72159.1 glutathione S-transferase [Amphiplicatus metriothermophilus]